MLSLLFTKGVIVGFSLAAPIGKIGILCIRRTLAHGLLVGVLSGLGAATADATYGVVAGLGLTAMAHLLIKYKILLSLCGGSFLSYLGIRTLRSEPAGEMVLAEGEGALTAFASTFFLTVTAPITLLALAAVLTGAGIFSATGDVPASIAIVGGVFTGAVGWWLFLCCSAGYWRSRLDLRKVRRLNKIAGLVILAFAAYMFLEGGIFALSGN